MNVMWVDPGETTGWAIGRWDGVDCLGVDVGEIPCLKENLGVEELMVLIAAGDLDVLGIEDFRLFRGRGGSADPSGLSPVRVTAKIEWELYRNRLHYTCALVKQMPGEKDVVKDGWMKERGLWKPGLGHAMDALRHLVVWSRKNGVLL